MALHGLEEAAGVRYRTSGTHAGEAMPGSPVAVRYADDMVVLCHSQEQAVQVKAQLAQWLAPRGLAFSDEKTKIVSLESGYDFLGFNIRRYRNGKLLIKPSKAAVRRVKHKLATEMRRLRGQNASAVLAAICPITRGWASFYRSVVSKETFATVDDCACSRCSTGAARSARTCSCTPTGSPILPRNGNGGTAPPAKRSPGSSSHADRAARRMMPASYTPTATAGQPVQAARNRHLHAPKPPFGACLSRMRSAPQVRFLGGRGRSNAPRLPDVSAQDCNA